ncbi:MAG: DUF5906 domain-containing protein [Bacteroidota bacterium]
MCRSHGDREWLEGVLASPLTRALAKKVRWSPYALSDHLDERPKDKGPRRLREAPGPFASVSDASSWSGLEDALRVALTWRSSGHPRAGVGVHLLGLSGVMLLDLDGCRDPSEIDDDAAWATDLLRECGSHRYVTPSGSGYRVVLRVPSDEPTLHTVLPRPDGGGLEAYVNTGRFVTVLPGEGDVVEAPVGLVARLREEQGVAADAEAREALDWDAGRELPEDAEEWDDRLRELLAECLDGGDRSEGFNRLAWAMASRGYSPRSSLAGIEEHAPELAEKYQGRLEAEFARCVVKFVDARWSETLRDFDPVLADEMEARRRAEGPASVRAMPLRTRVLTMRDAMEDLVYLSETGGVFDRRAGRAFKSFELAAGHFAASRTEVEGREVPVIAAWRKADGRLARDRLTWAPDMPEFCPDPEHGLDAVNTWRGLPPYEAPPDWLARSAPFVDHVAYLVPFEDERRRFLDWLAHVVQRPGELPHTAYLMVTPTRGVGRNWLASVLAQVLRGHVALGLKLHEVTGDGFNGRLSRKLLAVVDEVREGTEGKQRRRLANDMQNAITQEHRNINPKFGVQEVQYNCMRLLMFSNYFDAVPIERRDRRVNVIYNPTERRLDDDYRELYGLRDDPAFLSSVRRWLEERDLSGFNPGEHAMANEAKTRMLDQQQGDEESDLRDFIEAWPGPVCLRSDVEEALPNVSARHLKHLLDEAGCVPLGRHKRVNVDGKGGKKVGVVLLKPSPAHDLEWAEGLPPAYLREMCEGFRSAYRATTAAGDFDPLEN